MNIFFLVLGFLIVALISFFCGSMYMVEFLSDPDLGASHLSKICMRQTMERLKNKGNFNAD